ncbi:MAG: tRNA-dihydrouridine synthase [Myxococcota bacterium]|nr:tRNA-dihydrouridine synthase [Myxococcota bacterium]
MLHFGSVDIPTPALLAPMSGITDRPFRRLIRRCNPDAVGLYTTEFISIEALWNKSQRSIEMMRTDPDEAPFAVQLFGRDIERMVHAGRIAVERGAQIVDINCGCPAPKVVKRGGGAALMKEPDHFEALATAMVEALPVPVTVKTRSGWDEANQNVVEIARRAERAGVSAIAVHPRSRQKLYSGQANWSLVAQVVRAVSIPVIGSGDVCTPEDETSLAQASGCAAFMVGRGALHNPFIFRELAAARRGDALPEASKEERIALLVDYARLLAEDLPERAWIGRLKNVANRMTQPWQAPNLRRRLLRSGSAEELLDHVRRAADVSAGELVGEELDAPEQ